MFLRTILVVNQSFLVQQQNYKLTKSKLSLSFPSPLDITARPYESFENILVLDPARCPLDTGKTVVQIISIRQIPGRRFLPSGNEESNYCRTFWCRSGPMLSNKRGMGVKGTQIFRVTRGELSAGVMGTHTPAFPPKT